MSLQSSGWQLALGWTLWAERFAVPRWFVFCIAAGTLAVLGKRRRALVSLNRPLPKVDVVYAADPVIALGVDNRKVITWADFESEKMLRGQTYQTSVPMSVALVLPVHFETTTQGNVIRRCFPQAHEWRGPVPLNNSCQAWVAELVPDKNRTPAVHPW